MTFPLPTNSLLGVPELKYSRVLVACVIHCLLIFQNDFDIFHFNKNAVATVVKTLF